MLFGKPFNNHIIKQTHNENPIKKIHTKIGVQEYDMRALTKKNWKKKKHPHEQEKKKKSPPLELCVQCVLSL